MSFFRENNDKRRDIFLALSGSVESQLRDQFAKKSHARTETQSSIADKIGVNRSVINRRLTGQTNMTLESVADLVWALGCCIDIDIYDPTERPEINHPLGPETIPASYQINLTTSPVKTYSSVAKTTMSKLKPAL
ncbi:helix-turn-helix transcriptional regulator [Methylobacterium sp. W2]|uniref:helix-turn-helix domain-containing protein n=1 Tax=Methylobacterium sp. W2 TaxID=2598107 RepID=UPI001D0C7CF8|nr:helix-turn-helix domain-containing protein [Methylobacterium sp. W2]MCC0807594.1 helix-turn-helix transcriptional regulator [Methylobacterium sp. W2]